MLSCMFLLIKCDGVALTGFIFYFGIVYYKYFGASPLKNETQNSEC
ncbi:hypothetical protein TRIP_D210015 [uncultured Paludibacter sp.]|nr:hypothetical protein TRIP_D210015 [uncultured Paludibacter sp.]